LWRRANDRAVTDKISRADGDSAFKYNMRLHNGTFAKRDLRTNNGKGPNLDAGSNLCAVVDDRGRMNLCLFHLRFESPLPFKGRVRVNSARVWSNPSPLSSPLIQGERR